MDKLVYKEQTLYPPFYQQQCIPDLLSQFETVCALFNVYINIQYWTALTDSVCYTYSAEFNEIMNNNNERTDYHSSSIFMLLFYFHIYPFFYPSLNELL